MASTPRSLLAIVLFFLLASFLLPNSDAVNPALKSFIDQSALDYFQSVVIPILLQNLGTISVPDISGSVDAPIGSIDYKLTSIQISNFAVTDPTIQIVDSGITAAVSSLSADSTLDWSYELSIWPHPGDSGNANIAISQTTVQLSASLQPTSDGKISLTVLSTSVSIGKLDITLSGGESWLYQIFVDIFTDEIEAAANSAIESAIQGQVQTLINQILSQIPVTVPVLALPIELDFALMDTIVTSPGSWISAHHLGEFYYTENPQEAPFDRPELPDLEPTRMCQLIASEFFVNSALFSLYSSGSLDVEILPSELPPSSPLQLNTSSFCLFASELCKEYPDELMTVVFNATKSPVSATSPEGINATIEATLDFSIILPNATQIPAFTLDLVASLNGSGYIVNGNQLGIAIDYNKGILTLVSSEVGPIQTKLLQFSFDLAMKDVVMPDINKIFSKGISLPVISGASFVNPEISYTNGYAILDTDLHYDPSSLMSINS